MQRLGTVLKWILVFLGVQFLLRVNARANPYRIPAPLVPLISLPYRQIVHPLPHTFRAMGISPGMTVLEVGAGTGYFALPLAEYLADGKMIALDVSHSVLQRLRRAAERRGIENLVAVESDAVALPFADGSFDHAVMALVLGELHAPDRVLEEVFRVLRSGGMLSIAECIVDEHFHFSWETRDTVIWAGFELLNMQGNALNYIMNFRKIQ